MIRFLLKTFLLIVLLFIGVLIGFQEANEGLLKMKGYEDPEFQDAFTVELYGDNEYEATILGERMTNEDLEEKKKLLEEISTNNFFTNTAKTFGELIKGFFDMISGE